MPLGDLAVPVLHSRDLTTWRPLGDALTLNDDAFEALWAPEVAYHGGKFYMYFSAGGHEGEGHQLRVATATRPEGPFEDSGAVLTPDDPFTIDAHPFRDADGNWYLYYCRDFLDEEGGRAGTGIVVDRLLGMTRLAGERRTVVRPFADWQLYERRRRWYGRVWDWYTAEGPFVRERDGRYYCLYSGGAWKEPNYGVSYVVSDDPMGPFVPDPGAERGPEVLRTLPGSVVGPGHASVVSAPDNLHDHIVYHAWDPDHTKRLMRVDRLDWKEDGPSSPGPTLEAQPAPSLPAFRDLFDGPDGTPPDPEAWLIEDGDWRQTGGELVQRDAGAGTILLAGVRPIGDYLFETNLRLVQPADGPGSYGVCLDHGPGGRTYLTLSTDGSCLLYAREANPARTREEPATRLPVPNFEPGAYHRLLVSARNGRAEVRLDGTLVASGLQIPGTTSVGPCTRKSRAAFDGVALTMLAEP